MKIHLRQTKGDAPHIWKSKQAHAEALLKWDFRWPQKNEIPALSPVGVLNVFEFILRNNLIFISPRPWKLISPPVIDIVRAAWSKGCLWFRSTCAPQCHDPLQHRKCRNFQVYPCFPSENPCKICWMRKICSMNKCEMQGFFPNLTQITNRLFSMLLEQ